MNYHKLVAKIKKKFWAHCPKCHCHFGGHQGYEQHIHIDGVNYRYVCKKCHLAIEKKVEEVTHAQVS